MTTTHAPASDTRPVKCIGRRSDDGHVYAQPCGWKGAADALVWYVDEPTCPTCGGEARRDRQAP